MPFHTAIQLTPPLVFLIFIFFIFLATRAAKVFLRALLFAAVGFSFPWAAQFLGVNIGFAATFSNGLIFAAGATGIFFVYNFLHILLALLKIITWPIRKILNIAEKNEIKNLRKEVAEIEAEKKRK